MGGLFGKPDTSAQEAQLAEMRKQNEIERKRLEEDRRRQSEDAASRIRARQRGGSRMLLSSTRLNPETGVETLGSNMIG
jgi:hypothetical protein